MENEVKELVALIKKLTSDIKEIKEKQERLVDYICGSSYSQTAYQFRELLAQFGGDARAAVKEHNRRQKLLYKINETAGGKV